MKCLFQLMHMDTGQRSDVLEMEPAELAELLSNADKAFDLGNQAVIVLMEKPIPDEEYQFSKAPFMMATTFTDHFKRQAA